MSSWNLGTRFVENSTADVRLSPLSFSSSTLSLGCCYAYLTYKRDRNWMKFTVLGRASAALLFARAGGALETVAYYEAGMGLLTALVLWSGR